MRAVYRAEDEPVATRAEYWRHVLDEAAGPMEVHFDAGADFQSRIVTGDVGAARVPELTDGPGEAYRTRRHIRRSTPDLYQVFTQVRGRTVGEQDGREASLAPGDIALADLSRPFRCAHRDRQAVCLTFPRALMPLNPDDVAQLTAVRIPGDRGAAALASSLIRQLPRHLDDDDGPVQARLGTSVLDVLAVALAARLDRQDDLPAETRQQALLQRIYAFIEEKLADPELSPTGIAAAHHVSLRYLHKLFETEGLPVASWIRQRRLDRCRKDLVDPALGTRPVGAIARRWGFLDAAHFSRVFRAAYGVPPSEYRRVIGLRRAR
jgi:AraC-like DNA-binding protein